MTWRKCPFNRGERYRVKRSFSKFQENFIEGQILEFIQDGYSHYDNLTIFAFKDVRSGQQLSLEITDNEQIETWSENFEHEGK